MTAVAEPRAGSSSPLYDLGSEQAVIGAMLLDRAVIGEVRQIVTDVEMFYSWPHRLLFQAICDLDDAKQPTSAQAILAHLATTDASALRKLGNGVYVSEILENVPLGVSGPYYARIVADRAVLRALDEACVRIRNRIHSGAGTTGDLLESARLMVADLAGRVAATDGPVRWRDLLTPGCDELEALGQGEGTSEGIPTGFPDLDRLIHGLKGGQVYALAGMSGSGKSTFAGDLIRSAAFTCQQPTLVFNMEMSRLELFNKLVCAHASVDHGRLTGGRMTDDDWVRVAKVCGETEDAPLWIDDSPGQSLADIRVKAHRLHREHGPLKLIVVDLIGLVEPPAGDTREQQVAAISRALKVLAGELDAAVVVVAQLNRGPNQRADKRPNQHDLRESAQISHDASAVILIHRPEQHDRSAQVGEAIFIVDKNRFGPEGDVTVAAQLHLSRFYSMAVD